MSKNKDLEFKTKVRKPKKKCVITKLLTLLTVIALIAFLVQVVLLDILPFQLLLIVVVLFVSLTFIVLFINGVKVKRFIPRLIMGIITLALFAGLCAGNYYIFMTSQMFADVTSLANKTAHTETIASLKSSSIESKNDLNGKIIGTVLATDETDTEKMLSALKKDGINVTTEDYPSLNQMVDALYAGEVDAICLNESYRGILHDSEAYFNFNTDTNKVYQNVYYTEKSESENPSDSVDNITTDTFTILISGNDSYGDLTENSRSDANMLVTVNPVTHRILLTSIPRDYYVNLVCTDSTGCPADSKDKLTHSGIHGVASTEATIENLLGITINYNVRINFSSVTNLVDALGGIDITVEEGEEVETFYANGQPGVTVGENHLDGESALAFARERHAYENGDEQRVKNQQTVLKAIFNKMTSSSMFVNYPKFMDALSVAFDTNMSSKEMSKLLKYELALRPSWTFESYALAGEQGNEFCYELQNNAYVTYPNDEMVEIAKKKIEAIIDGKKASSVSEELTGSSSNDEDQSVEENTQPVEPSQPSYYEEPYYEEPTYDYGSNDQYYDYSQDYSDSSQEYYDPNQGSMDQGYSDETYYQ